MTDRLRSGVLSPPGIALITGAGFLALALASLHQQTGIVAGIQALFDAPRDAFQQTAVHLAWWPRLAVALLSGAGLALAGVLFQQVLRNPLAAPTTLGIASGANLGLMAVTLMAPGLLAFGREWVALAGGGLAMGLVFLLAWRRDLAPVVVVLAGLVVNLYFGALGMVLLLFHAEELKGLLIWGAGSLAQNGWEDTVFLAPRLLIGAILAWFLLRPLALLELDDASVQSLGISVKALRFATLGVAVFITGCVVSVAGLIGFIGLAAPNIVRLAGARRLGPRLVWSALLGALLLATTDLLLQTFTSTASEIPTGATTALLGAPLLLWLLPRLRLEGGTPPTGAGSIGWRASRPTLRLLLAGLALVGVTGIALAIGQGAQGWLATFQWDALQWRVPRVLASAASGVMLAIAGAIIQRVSGNPIASPEVLGISAGSAIALIGGVALLSAPDNTTLVLLGTLGALGALAVLVGLNRSNGFLPERLLLTGVAIAAIFDAVRSIFLAGGDPRGQQVLAWLSGSTYYVDLPGALVALTATAILGLAAVPFVRWLDLLPLGTPTAQALGIAVDRARLALLVLVAVLTACATLIVGPLSFVGLLAPHMARMAGFARAGSHLAAAALLGALLMILADWLGRQLLFPEEIPAGLMASLVGGAYFMWSLRRI